MCAAIASTASSCDLFTNWMLISFDEADDGRHVHRCQSTMTPE